LGENFLSKHLAVQFRRAQLFFCPKSPLFTPGGELKFGAELFLRTFLHLEEGPFFWGGKPHKGVTPIIFFLGKIPSQGVFFLNPPELIYTLLGGAFKGCAIFREFSHFPRDFFLFENWPFSKAVLEDSVRFV